MMTIADAARVTRKYHAISAIKNGSFPAWWVEDIPKCKLVAGPFTEILKAQAACDLLNLLAVLESDAIRNPSEKMVTAAERAYGLWEGFLAENGWRTMIDALIAEVREQGNG